MAVFRIEKTRDYTVMSNYHLRDMTLSLKAKGLLSLKCAAGAVNTNCPVCKNNLSECSGKEAAVEPEPEPEQPAKKSSGGLLLIVLLLALAGGGAFAYVKFIKPRQGVKVSADPDDYDFEDEETVNEDEQEDTE